MTFMKNLMNLLKLTDLKNEVTNQKKVDISYQYDLLINKKEADFKRMKNKFSKSDLDTFLWQCNSVAEERYRNTASEFDMRLENPDDELETGYHYAMKEIADESEKK